MRRQGRRSGVGGDRRRRRSGVGGDRRAAELRELNRDEFLDRIERLRSLVDGTPAGKAQRFMLEYPTYAANGGGLNYEIARVAQLRWVVEGLGRIFSNLPTSRRWPRQWRGRPRPVYGSL